MSVKPRIAVIIGSTRPSRFADKPAQWILKQARARDDIDVELVDLRDYPLPFFDEMASNRWMPSQNPEAVRWQQTVGRFDGFIFVVPEYNHSISAVLKNALDQAYKEWNRKPFTAIGYGGTGAALSATAGAATRTARIARIARMVAPHRCRARSEIGKRAAVSTSASPIIHAEVSSP